MAALLPGAALLVATSSAAKKATHGLAEACVQGVVRAKGAYNRDVCTCRLWGKPDCVFLQSRGVPLLLMVQRRDGNEAVGDRYSSSDNHWDERRVLQDDERAGRHCDSRAVWLGD